jgi:hypothetical protein
VASKRYGLSKVTKEKVGLKAKGRELIGGDGSYEVMEFPAPYKGIFGQENGVQRLRNVYFWIGIF